MIYFRRILTFSFTNLNFKNVQIKNNNKERIELV
jgi:hypothetical protein